MSPNFLQIALLGVLQGAAELLPVSSSAHVIVAEKLMRLDPTTPEMTFLLVMLHTGTMFAVVAYFWNAWRESYFASVGRFGITAVNVAAATLFSGVVFKGIEWVVKKTLLHDASGAEVEQLFGHLPFIAAALAAAGLLIFFSGLRGQTSSATEMTLPPACWIGLVQGLSLPFRGFSRSGATISAGLLLGVRKRAAEEFSFALAVVLTPAAIFLEWHRLSKANAAAADPIHWSSLMAPGLVGMACSFVAGLLALKLLSSWLEKGRWHYFGVYCLLFAAVVFGLYRAGY